MKMKATAAGRGAFAVAGGGADAGVAFTFGALVGPLGHRGLFFVSAAFTAVTFAIVLRYRPRAAMPSAG